MTHDFHYYCTYMCARNANYSPESSHKIALCADMVDGLTMPAYASRLVNSVKSGNTQKYVTPVTVHQAFSHIHKIKSMGSSIMTIPWMAFHFLPSLEVDPKKNEFLPWGKIEPSLVTSGNTKEEIGDANRSLILDHALVCCKNSDFAKRMITDTAMIASQHNAGDVDDKTAAILGLRAHIISDLFAHEGFSGIRSMSMNALSSIKNLRKDHMNYSPLIKSAELASKLKASRVGHAQAGQYPDEPFIKYNLTRKANGVFSARDNYENFGMAIMTVTEALKGNANMNYDAWRRTSENYKYKWDSLKLFTNQDRGSRNSSWLAYIHSEEKTISNAISNKKITQGLTAKDWYYCCGKINTRIEGFPKLPMFHDSSDSWSINVLKSASAKLVTQFVLAADSHLKWFHETFFALAGCNVSEYLAMSILWNAGKNKFGKEGDYQKAIRINNELISGGEVKVASESGHMNGTMIGVSYMKGSKNALLKPSDVFKKMILPRTKPPQKPKRPLPKLPTV